jgi:Acyl-CoA thioesterase C-terminal domain/Acyl-CoA thioesterase N-terminal domain
VPDAFYLPLDGERFESTKATAGPWDPGFQHGGPPCALLARAIEGCEPVPGSLLVRFTAEFLGPVPVAELAVAARVVRGGRRVQLVEAELAAAGRPVLRAQGWRLRHERDPDLPATGDLVPPPLSAGEVLPVPGYVEGYSAAMEWRLAGGNTAGPGPAAVWSRQRIPLVAGEEPSPVQRAAAVADSGNGVSWELDVGAWTFVNVDLTVHLVRPPEGEWICLDARTQLDPGGVGLASSSLYDHRGLLGRGAQALLVARR